MENVTIKVEPQILKSISMDVVASIEKTESAFREIDNIIERTREFQPLDFSNKIMYKELAYDKTWNSSCKIIKEELMRKDVEINDNWRFN